jgi:hypothetical protein
VNTLRILGHPVKVHLVEVPLQESALGQADAENGEIRIRADLEKSVEQATLLHEVIHVLDHHLDLGLTEEQVAGIGQGLFQVLRDNPLFTKELVGTEE